MYYFEASVMIVIVVILLSSFLCIYSGMKALSISKETFIRINSRGLACIQHQVESFKGQDVYIDFLMTSEDLSDDQSDDEVQNDE